MVHDAINDCGSHDFVAEDSAPVFEVSVGGKNGGFVLITVSDDFEEVVECLRVECSEPDFVEDEEVRSKDLLDDTSV